MEAVVTNEGDPMTTHMADCRVSYCRGCVSPEIADLGVEARAALLAAEHVPKAFELDLPTPTQGETR